MTAQRSCVRLFSKALSTLGAEDRGWIVAALEEFEKDWRGGRPIDDIRKQWDYKAPKVSKACTGFGMRQIRPTNDTRAWLAPHNESNKLLLLFVIRKSSQPEQRRTINWLCKSCLVERASMNISHTEPEVNLDEFDLDFEPSGKVGDLGRELENDDDVSPHYHRARWIAQTISTLRQARYDSDQSQQDIADALGTKQPAIARLERSEDITLGRIWDYLHACGRAPVELETVHVPARRHGQKIQDQNGSVARRTKSG